jgi:tetratricopeptide (TPR) repeat protein
LVAILNEKQRKDLGLPSVPDWLKFYKEDSTKVSYLKNIGYFYNDVGAYNSALGPLLKAYKKDPCYDGVVFELAFAYNALNEFDKAIPILEKAIKTSPDIYSFYRELGFAYKNTNQIEKAAKIYLQGIELCDNNFQKSEMAVNMAQAYFELRNREKFDKWAKLTRKFAESGSEYSKYIDQYEKQWKDKR